MSKADGQNSSAYASKEASIGLVMLAPISFAITLLAIIFVMR